MIRPTLSLVLTQYINESPRGETEEVDRLRSSKSEHSSEGFKQAMQTKKKGNIQVKYLSSPHSIHYTNSIGYINSIMTPK